MNDRWRGRPTLPEAIDASSLFGALAKAEKPVLVVLTGPQVGQRIILEAAAMLGRDPEADMMLVDEAVEWHHAMVFPRDGAWSVRDISGESRTEVNGEPIDERALEDDDQIIIGGTVIRFEFHDAVEQAYDQEIQARLTKDDLTGLLARRTFDQALKSGLMASRRRDSPFSLLVVDIDGVKGINDRLGHLVGAKVIAWVGKIIGEQLSGRATACRLGGDEFAVALPGVAAAEAQRVAEALRGRVRDEILAHEGERLVVRVSIGVASSPEHGTSPLELQRRADEAMYVAKRAGGDGVSVFTPPAPLDF